jgi:teichoic acid transport system ATP-binding protein
METKTVIRFSNVSKEYHLYKSSKQRLISTLTGHKKGKKKLAVNNLNFEIKKGEAVAFLGRNGAGKSTILKMVTEVAFPTTGEIFVDGRVGALLELSAGFDPEFTGRENIYLKGHILGLQDKEISQLEPAIVEFADLGDYIDQPVRTYSSGMKARLGFSINVNIQPDILIVDEALSVGDEEFRKKCITRVNQLLSSGDITLMFVTHSITVAKSFCTRGIVMNGGQAIFDGPIEEAAQQYNALITKPKK